MPKRNLKSLMKKKDVVFTIGLTIFMGVLWIVGEIVMGLWIPVVPKTHLWWFVGIVSVTLIISVAQHDGGRIRPQRPKA